MSKKPTITLNSIAQTLKLSVPTVSRVLNGQSRRYRISEKTEKLVLSLAKKLNFTPNRLAQGLRLNKTMTIGLTIPDISNPFFATISSSIEKELRNRGYSIIICDNKENTSCEIESIDILVSHMVDGLIIVPVGESSDHLIKFEDQHLPIVLVDRYFSGTKLPYVASDNYQGAYDAMAYLIHYGHKDIACIQGLRNTLPNCERVRGYRQALKDHKLTINESYIVGDYFGMENGYVETKLLLQNNSKITAVMALNNLIALGAVRAISEEGLHIPNDISIIGFDDQPYCAYIATPLTMVAQNEEEIGKITVKLLLDQIAATEPLTRKGILLPTFFKERASVRKIS